MVIHNPHGTTKTGTTHNPSNLCKLGVFFLFFIKPKKKKKKKDCYCLTAFWRRNSTDKRIGIARDVAGRRTVRWTGVEDTELLLPQASSKAHEEARANHQKEGTTRKNTVRERERATLSVKVKLFYFTLLLAWQRVDSQIFYSTIIYKLYNHLNLKLLPLPSSS